MENLKNFLLLLPHRSRRPLALGAQHDFFLDTSKCQVCNVKVWFAKMAHAILCVRHQFANIC